MKRSLFSLFLFFAVCCTAYAQRTVTGTVTDGNETLPSVNVVVKGTTTGVITDLDGKYTIEVPEGSTVLVYSFIGYDSKEITLEDGKNSYDIVIVEGATKLNQVVVSASRRTEKILDAPASVSVINAEKIESNTALSVVDHLAFTPGVDKIKTGLISADVNLRGFNNIFSGAMLTIVDNRIARVPSLRVNAYQLIPTNNLDIERIEIVRGPGSALYGPSAADGVFAMWTRSPLDIEGKFETTVSLAAGVRAKSSFAVRDNGRAIISPEFWHAGKINDKIGYKISGAFFKGSEFEYYDPREPAIGDTLIFGTVRDGNVFETDTSRARETFDRDFDIIKYNFDARIDFRPTDDIDIIFNGGLARTSNIELTGLGAAQGTGWVFGTAQARFRWKKLYFQYFMNSSNSGDTYLLPQVSGALGPHNVQTLVDKSKLHVATIQHSFDAIKSQPEKLNFIYGVDVLFTQPETEGTINGRFEDEDNIFQAGGYVQGEYNFHPKLTLIAAGRVDYHSEVDGAFISPRAALVYKPSTRHTFRATYNRAFSPPNSLNLSLDLSNGLIPNGINVRGIGNPDGYNYRYDEQGMPQYISPYTGEWYSANDNSNSATFFDGMTAIVSEGLAQQAPDNLKPLVPNLVAGLLAGIAGENGTIAGVEQVFVDYVELAETGDFDASTFDLGDILDAPPIDNSTNQTWEFGYKGIIKSKLFVTADFWVTKQGNYVSPLVTATASAMFDPAQLQAALGPNEPGGLLFDNVTAADALIAPLLDGNPAYGDGIPNGTAYDEVRNIIVGAAAQIPNGSVTPDDDKVGSDVILIYRNLGDVVYGGMDLGFNYLFNDNFTFSGSYSFVNKERFELEGAQGGFVALNAPQHKTSAVAEYKNKKTGLGARIGWRWQDGFLANSAIYIGQVRPANFVDLNVSYKLPIDFPKMVVSFDVNNLLNYQHQRFPGTPPIGTIAIGKVAMTF